MTDTLTTVEGRQLPAADALRFLLAGNATVTLRSVKTGTRFTYKITTPEEARPGSTVSHFVALLAGPNNENDYHYLGEIRNLPRDESLPLAFPPGRHFTLGAKSKIPPTAPSVKAFEWTFKRLVAGLPLEGQVEVWHEGRCGRCGRTLTVPESIERGIGPECAAIMGLL